MHTQTTTASKPAAQRQERRVHAVRDVLEPQLAVNVKLGRPDGPVRHPRQ